MITTISRLSSDTINQIAAGEVIEHPASVVKELVENSIDAGACHITIEILSGGFQSIKISDNGSGMHREDALLSLERHATSKLRLASDLFHLATMGFRGEALASIASISKLEMITAAQEGSGVKIQVHGGAVQSAEPAARVQGTTIEVCSLFYNVPARKEFQKSIAASSSEITKTLTHLALAHPHVGFTLIQQHKTLFSLQGDTLKNRASALLDKEFIESSKLFECESAECKAIGLISDPLHSRHNRSGQYLFINNRPIQCPALSFAIKQAYGTFIDTDRHPLYLLHLTIPAPLVDVNVHPQKKEVRLKNESFIKETLRKAVSKALSQAPSSAPIPSLLFTPTSAPSFSSPLLVREDRPSEQLSLPFLFLPQPIGLYGHYLITRPEGLPLSALQPGLFFFDLMAAKARIAFDALLHAPSAQSQSLLFPLSLSFSIAETTKLHTYLPLLRSIGIHIEPSGKTSFLIDALPVQLEENAARDLLHELLTLEGICPKEVLCALTAKRIPLSTTKLSIDEAVRIIQQLFKTQDPHHCPKGQSTYFFLKESDIENRFKRL